ncbi:hypothetical protein [Streptomyces sp. NPDC101237]|uniref:hypothetical protein n=1 Tax=Streptomyces sp. NPDC101237 TaxID=3366139 RepID=UPI00380D4346
MVVDILHPRLVPPLAEFSTSGECQVKTATTACQLYGVDRPMHGRGRLVELALADQRPGAVPERDGLALLLRAQCSDRRAQDRLGPRRQTEEQVARTSKPVELVDRVILSGDIVRVAPVELCLGLF